MRDKSQPWIKRSLKEKRKHVIDSHHEPPVACLLCETRVMPQDVWAHDDRCPGRLDAHRLDKWLPEGAAAERLPTVTLRRLAAAGTIRSRETDRGQEYLVRDVWHAVRASELYAVRSPEAHPVASEAVTMTRLQERILEELELGAMTERSIRRKVHRNDRDVGRALKALLRMGKVARRYRRSGRMFERASSANLDRATEDESSCTEGETTN